MIVNIIMIAVGGFVARTADGLLGIIGAGMFVVGVLGCVWFLIAFIGAFFSRNR